MFGLIYVMTQGGPGTATYMPEYLIWVMQGDTNRLGYATAIGMVLFLFVGACGLLQITFLLRGNTNWMTARTQAGKVGRRTARCYGPRAPA